VEDGIYGERGLAPAALAAEDQEPGGGQQHVVVPADQRCGQFTAGGDELVEGKRERVALGIPGKVSISSDFLSACGGERPGRGRGVPRLPGANTPVAGCRVGRPARGDPLDLPPRQRPRLTVLVALQQPGEDRRLARALATHRAGQPERRVVSPSLGDRPARRRGGTVAAAGVRAREFDQPVRCRRDRRCAKRLVPCVAVAVRALGGRQDHVAAVAADVEPRPDLAGAARHRRPVRVAEPVVPTATRRDDRDRPRQPPVRALEVSERGGAVVAVDVEHEQLRRRPGRDGHGRLRPGAPPVRHLGKVAAGVLEAVVRQRLVLGAAGKDR
jgi:hypothetical protein